MRVSFLAATISCKVWCTKCTYIPKKAYLDGGWGFVLVFFLCLKVIVLGRRHRSLEISSHQAN